MKKCIALILFITPLWLFAGEITPGQLEGQWNFAYMILDGETRQTVNRRMDFLPGGEVINYDRAGEEHSRASWVIQPGSITYSDQRGEQHWKVIEVGEDAMVVDHAGAEMHFERLE